MINNSLELNVFGKYADFYLFPTLAKMRTSLDIFMLKSQFIDFVNGFDGGSIFTFKQLNLHDKQSDKKLN